jgi:hypothetical protein
MAKMKILFNKIIEVDMDGARPYDWREEMKKQFPERSDLLCNACDFYIFYYRRTNEVRCFEFISMPEAIENDIKSKKFIKSEELFTKMQPLSGRLEVFVEENVSCHMNDIGYDPEHDDIHYSFNKSKKKGVGVDLGKGVIIRMDPKTKEWLGVSFLRISDMLKKAEVLH